MNSNDLARVLNAIAKHGSREYNTPSGAMLEELKAFALEGKLAEVAEGFALYGKAHRPSARFVAGRIPGLILNSYLMKREGVAHDVFERWSAEAENRSWGERLEAALRNPGSFGSAVLLMRDNLRKFRADERPSAA